MFKFLHAADIHLDSPLRGLERYPGAPVDLIRGATRTALQNLVQLALEEDVHFVVIAGDLYDVDWRDFQTGLFLHSQLLRLKEAGKPVYLIRGNHDAGNVMTKNLTMLDKTVHRFGDKRPEFVDLTANGCDVRIHGQSFATRTVTANLAQGYPDAMSSFFNIGLLHTSATGCSDHDTYAGCSLDDLRARGYQYWALGHVHQRDAVKLDDHMQFSGIIQGRNVRECGPKGCLVVTVDDRSQPDVQFHALDVLRWKLCRLEAGGFSHPDDLLTQAAETIKQSVDEADDRPLAIRIQVEGATAAHEKLAQQSDQWMGDLRAVANEQGQVWIEKIKLQTTPLPDDAPPPEGALAELLAVLREVRADDAQIAELAKELAPLRSKLPSELTSKFTAGTDCLDPTDPAWLRQVLDRVEPLLLGRLTGQGRG